MGPGSFRKSRKGTVGEDFDWHFETQCEQTREMIARDCGLVKYCAGNRENRVLDGNGDGINGFGGRQLVDARAVQLHEWPESESLDKYCDHSCFSDVPANSGAREIFFVFNTRAKNRFLASLGMTVSLVQRMRNSGH